MQGRQTTAVGRMSPAARQALAPQQTATKAWPAMVSLARLAHSACVRSSLTCCAALPGVCLPQGPCVALRRGRVLRCIVAVYCTASGRPQQMLHFPGVIESAITRGPGAVVIAFPLPGQEQDYTPALLGVNTPFTLRADNTWLLDLSATNFADEDILTLIITSNANGARVPLDDRSFATEDLFRFDGVLPYCPITTKGFDQEKTRNLERLANLVPPLQRESHTASNRSYKTPP